MSRIQLSFVEENYLKAIYHLMTDGSGAVTTNAIADSVNTRAASVTDMLKKLSAKKLIDYKKYYGVSMTDSGEKAALEVIRKHRLWETFLVEKLNFSWDQVHEVAEQLEHIQSTLLIQRIDALLGYPTHDPHGDPIPSEQGEISEQSHTLLSTYTAGTPGKVVAVNDSSPEFLRYLDRIGISIGSTVRIIEKIAFDGSLELEVEPNNKRIFVSKEVSDNLWIINQ
jgi:DtxR family transcriptional regulator, Mn-dependent transcriptional regulator